MILSQRLSLRNVVFVVALCCMSASRASATVHTVSVGNFFFTPAKTHVAHGDTVRWVWASGVHNSTSDASSPKSWASPNLSGPDQSFQAVFSSADGNGPFPYLCTIHPTTMKDTIFVTNLAVEVTEQSEIPGDYLLEQNYPNPFNPATTIRFAIPHSARVEVSIINVNGETVESNDLGLLRAGSYSMVWDGQDVSGRMLPSGVYFYRIKAGDFVETKKMVLLK
ncbi:MAG: T9SS type A sorting domain-containing protein [candidate division Zixibacteria bacterium]|nr:T9SS type A sorting domain-containing protein [candidate division Zixibacteria bacterium]